MVEAEVSYDSATAIWLGQQSKALSKNKQTNKSYFPTSQDYENQMKSSISVDFAKLIKGFVNYKLNVSLMEKEPYGMMIANICRELTLCPAPF